MGFEVARTAILTFEGTEWEGAEIHVRLDLSLGELLEVDRVLGKVRAGANADETNEAFFTFGGHVLKSWNLERDGVPLPCTAEDFKALPARLNSAIATVWSNVLADMTEVPDPLPVASGGGAPSGALTAS